MTGIDYIGFDIHKKTISFCAKALDGTILDEGTIPALRTKLLAWFPCKLALCCAGETQQGEVSRRRLAHSAESFAAGFLRGRSRY